MNRSTQRPAADALRRRLGAATEKTAWGWWKAQCGQGVTPGNCYEGRERRGTQSGPWLRRQRTAWRKLRCNGERPACRCRMTGACRSCGAANCVQKLRRRRLEAAGALSTLQPQGEEIAKHTSRSAGETEGKGLRDAVLGLVATSYRWYYLEANDRRGKGVRDAVCSGCHLRVSVRGVGLPRLGWGCRAMGWVPGEAHGALRVGWGNRLVRRS